MKFLNFLVILTPLLSVKAFGYANPSVSLEDINTDIQVEDNSFNEGVDAMRQYMEFKSNPDVGATSEPTATEDGTVTFMYADEQSNVVCNMTCTPMTCQCGLEPVAVCEGNQQASINGNTASCESIPASQDQQHCEMEGGEWEFNSFGTAGSGTCIQENEEETNYSNIDCSSINRLVQPEEFANCMNQQAEIEEEKERNAEIAKEQAQEKAEEDLAKQLETSKERAVSSCTPQYQNFISKCQNVSAQAPPVNQNFDSASGAAACRSLKESASSVITQVESQVNSCIAQGQGLFSACPVTTGSHSGRGSATAGRGATRVSRDASSTGSSNIEPNQQMVNEAKQIFNRLSSQQSEIRNEMTKLETESDKCIADFEGKEDQQKDESPETKDRWGGLAKTAQGAFDSLNRAKSGNISGSYAGSSELGRSGGGSSAASTPGYSSSGGSYGPSGSIDGGGLSGLPGIGGGSDSPGANSSKQTNTPFPTAGSNNNNARVNSVAGPARVGGGSGLSFSNEDTNFKVKDENGKRVYTNAKERNLVLGFKKAKVGGGGFATYSPDDFKKFGKTKMKQKLKEARETYGDHTPLLFQDGHFVRDLLQMKENLAWKRHNKRQKRRLSGLSDVDKKDEMVEVFHDCVRFEECYTEARYNIFKLHHFKFRKLVHPNNQ